jgi:hypothetical protein
MLPRKIMQVLCWGSGLFKTTGLSLLQNINYRFLSTPIMWNTIQSPLGPGTPETLRFPSAQSPMPVFFFVGRPTSPQSMSAAPESPCWRSPRPSISQTPLPTVSLLERPETRGAFSRHPNFELENPFGLKQLSRLHGILNYSKSHTSESSNDPPNQNSQAESLAQLHRRLAIQGPTANQPKISSTDLNDTWNNSNRQPPVGPQSATAYPDFSNRLRSSTGGSLYNALHPPTQRHHLSILMIRGTARIINYLLASNRLPRIPTFPPPNRLRSSTRSLSYKALQPTNQRHHLPILLIRGTTSITNHLSIFNRLPRIPTFPPPNRLRSSTGGWLFKAPQPANQGHHLPMLMITWNNLNYQPPVDLQSATAYPDFSSPESLAQLHRKLVLQSPTTNRPETLSTGVNDTWNNLNHQPPIDLQTAIAYPDSSSATTSIYLSPLQFPLDIPFSHLRVHFGGDSNTIGWNTLRPSVETLIEQTYYNPLKLTVTWSPSSSEDDPSGWRGGRTFKSLFDRLSMEMKPGRTLLTGVERISINVSEECGKVDVIPVTGLERTLKEQADIDADRIDLGSASNLKELFLQGSHIFFAEKLSNLPAGRLTLLSVTCCKISVNDTLVLLQVCSRLQDATFGTVSAENDCELGNRFTLKPGAGFRSKLKKFTITSFVDVSRIVRSLKWESSPTITINILDDVVAGQNWGPCFDSIPTSTQLTMNGNFPQGTIATFERNSWCGFW